MIILWPDRLKLSLRGEWGVRAEAHPGLLSVRGEQRVCNAQLVGRQVPIVRVR